MLNIIWLVLFSSAFICACYKFLVLGEQTIFADLLNAMFAAAKTSFEIALNLSGILSLWLGMLKLAEHSGFMQLLAKGLKPLFKRIMPDVPSDHPALGAIVLNMAANMLGLDNAATPLGIKAMQELQSLNPHPEQASNAQILFLVMNTSAITLFPVTIFAYRAQLGAAQPTDVFIPIILATYMASISGLIAVAVVQKINLLNKVVLAYLGGLTLFIAGMLTYFSSLSQAEMLRQSALCSQISLCSLVMAFILAAVYQRLNAYQLFVEGAKQGFQTAIGILPFLLAMLVAFAVFRASGALDWIMQSLRWLVGLINLDTRFIDGLPTALLKPFSGSAARAMMLDTMHSQGADSFAGHLVSTIQGSTETTFYVLAVYFGSVGISRMRHAVLCGMIADLGGILTAILVTYWFFG